MSLRQVQKTLGSAYMKSKFIQSALSPIAQAAQALGITPATLHDWRRRGWILCTQLPNGRYLVPQSEIDRLTATEGAQVVAS